MISKVLSWKQCVYTNFGAFAAVMFQVDVFWVVTPCSVVVECQRFGGLCCFLLRGEVFQKT